MSEQILNECQNYCLYLWNICYISNVYNITSIKWFQGNTVFFLCTVNNFSMNVAENLVDEILAKNKEDKNVWRNIFVIYYL